MNTKHHFTIGRRYWDQKGDTTYKAISDRYTARGYRWITFRDELRGDEFERRVTEVEGEEVIDLFGGMVKKPQLNDYSLLRSSMPSSYIAMTQKEDRVERGEEQVEMGIEELRNYLKKFGYGEKPVFKVTLIK